MLSSPAPPLIETLEPLALSKVPLILIALYLEFLRSIEPAPTFIIKSLSLSNVE